MNQWKRLPPRTKIIVLAVFVVAGAGCGGNESSTPTTNPTPEEEARAYARKVSGGDYEFGGLGAAAFSGCLEAILGEHVGPPGRSYKQEFPEPELQAVYKKALRNCGS